MSGKASAVPRIQKAPGFPNFNCWSSTNFKKLTLKKNSLELLEEAEKGSILIYARVLLVLPKPVLKRII